MNTKKQNMKEALDHMIYDWHEQSAENELNNIVERAEDLVRQLKNTKDSDYTPREKYQSMKNYINNFTFNIPQGHGCYNLSETVAIQKFLKEYEKEENNG